MLRDFVYKRIRSTLICKNIELRSTSQLTLHTLVLHTALHTSHYTFGYYILATKEEDNLIHFDLNEINYNLQVNKFYDYKIFFSWQVQWQAQELRLLRHNWILMFG